MCQCIAKLEADTLRFVTERQAEMGNTVLPINSMHDDGLDNTCLMLPGKEERDSVEVVGVQLHTHFQFRYTFEKKDGTTSNPKKGKLSISFNFCPICGEPYKKPKATGEPAGKTTPEEYTIRELTKALPSFHKIWGKDKDQEENPMPEGVKLTVYCDNGDDEKGFSENVTSDELGLNALIAHSWIRQSDLDNQIEDMRRNGK